MFWSFCSSRFYKLKLVTYTGNLLKGIQNNEIINTNFFCFKLKFYFSIIDIGVQSENHFCDLHETYNIYFRR
jgi:hypothetical protein